MIGKGNPNLVSGIVVIKAVMNQSARVLSLSVYKRIRRGMEELGPTFSKLGQVF